MNVRNVLLLFVGAAAVACGGKLAPDPDPSGSASSPAKGGQDDNGGTGSGGTGTGHQTGASAGRGPGTVVTLPPPRPNGPPGASCVAQGSSASSGGPTPGNASYSCMSEADYMCPAGPTTITCNCVSNDGVWAPGTCSCNGASFAFDCSQGCSPGAAEYAKCNLPPPDDDPGFGGSSTSSGG